MLLSCGPGSRSRPRPRDLGRYSRSGGPPALFPLPCSHRRQEVGPPRAGLPTLRHEGPPCCSAAAQGHAHAHDLVTSVATAEAEGLQPSSPFPVATDVRRWARSERASPLSGTKGRHVAQLRPRVMLTPTTSSPRSLQSDGGGAAAAYGPARIPEGFPGTAIRSPVSWRRPPLTSSIQSRCSA